MEWIRAALAIPFRELAKSPDRPSNKFDAFEGHLVHAYYDESSGRCELVEFGAGIDRPSLDGVDLLGEPFAALRDLFFSLDPEKKEDSAGLESAALGIGLYAPNADEDDQQPPEGVSVFAASYRQASIVMVD